MGLSPTFVSILLILITAQVSASDEGECVSDPKIIREITTYLERRDVGQSLVRRSWKWINPEILLHNLMTIKCIAISDEAMLARIFCGNQTRFLGVIQSYWKSVPVPEKYNEVQQGLVGSLYEKLKPVLVAYEHIPHLSDLVDVVVELNLPDKVDGTKPLHFCDRIEGVQSNVTLDLDQFNSIVGNLIRKRRKSAHFFELQSNCPEVQMRVEMERKRKFLQIPTFGRMHLDLATWIKYKDF